MTVLVRMTMAGMDAAAYDQAAGQLGPLVTKQPGFIMHVAYPSPGGFTVGEVWESRGQYETWFNANVKPNVPGDIKQEVIEVHAVLQP
jgi:heme-degrading monooxygenase HmoA